MSEGYFAKVDEKSKFNDILKSIELQETRSLKKLKYNAVKKILLSDIEFQCLLNPISQSNFIYSQYGQFSRIGEKGFLQCIAISNLSTNAQLIAYTGGRTFPLYVSYAK